MLSALRSKLDTFAAVLKGGAWISTVNALLSTAVTYGVLDAAQQSVVKSAITGGVSAITTALAFVHGKKVHTALKPGAPTATLVSTAEAALAAAKK